MGCASKKSGEPSATSWQTVLNLCPASHNKGQGKQSSAEANRVRFVQSNYGLLQSHMQMDIKGESNLVIFYLINSDIAAHSCKQEHTSPLRLQPSRWIGSQMVLESLLTEPLLL
jgi:hypothetical protein